MYNRKIIRCIIKSQASYKNRNMSSIWERYQNKRYGQLKYQAILEMNKKERKRIKKSKSTSRITKTLNYIKGIFEKGDK